MAEHKDKESDLKKVLEAITKLNYINPDDIPDIPLYMDQLTTFMDEQLSSYKRFDDDKGNKNKISTLTS